MSFRLTLALGRPVRTCSHERMCALRVLWHLSSDYNFMSRLHLEQGIGLLCYSDDELRNDPIVSVDARERKG